jgi:hypothetical protein
VTGIFEKALSTNEKQNKGIPHSEIPNSYGSLKAVPGSRDSNHRFCTRRLEDMIAADSSILSGSVDV